MEALRSADEIRDVNTRYHDVAAASYDSKWGIDFGAVGQAQVVGKLRKLLGPELHRGFGRSLEIGAGTGYFSLNLLQAGIVREATCTDISPGMVATLAENANRLGLDVRAARADAESLPFGGHSFDLVLGHAVLHHLPDLARAFAELHRVLRPGGRIAFAGEPSRIGDRLVQPGARGHRRSHRRTDALAPVRIPRLPPAPAARSACARTSAATGHLLQPAADRAQAVATPRPRGPWCGCQLIDFAGCQSASFLSSRSGS